VLVDWGQGSIGDPHLWNIGGWDRKLKNRSFQQLKRGPVHVSEDVTEKKKKKSLATSKKKLMDHCINKKKCAFNYVHTG